MKLAEFEPEIADESRFHYRLYDWQGLNQDNYKTYKGMDGIAEQIAFLESKLTANLLGFARGVEWQIEERITVKITECKANARGYKDAKVMTFDLAFATNMRLPHGVGIGKGSALGYGKIVKHSK